MRRFAHSLPGRPESDWEPLEVHLREVAEGSGGCGGAAGFAEPFGAAELGRLAGLWHDLGKFAPQFQSYIRASAAGVPAARVDHSTAGALLATRRSADSAAGVLAFVIAGHHAGLADLGSPQCADRSCLVQRLTHAPTEAEAALASAPVSLVGEPLPPLPAWVSNGLVAPLRLALFIRMLFSCLIDADRLATENFCNPERGQSRAAAGAASMGQLRAVLDDHLASFSANHSGVRAPVDSLRADLLRACRGAAERPPGLFSLTAPTGSGKTLSSMAFALRHAELHGMRRVIYALPFTSVTEQNAAVFRGALGALGEHVVLEHHSAYRPQMDDEDHPTELWRRLATENWDAPVVVTTNVQLLESLFAWRPSDCRKLHRVAKSVIILDEAQALPVHLLRPTLAALQELAASYGTSVVLASATMPAVVHRPEFAIGLRDVREIVPDPAAMSRATRRAKITPVGAVEDATLAARIAAEPQALAIVNTRAHAARLFGLVKELTLEALHLSALMCPEHRSRRVQEVKERLADGQPCRVVSTQVVEAGVDIDFPVVFRALAGLDSIIQAAGRCNREGRRPQGRVEVFETDERPPLGIRPAIDATTQVLEPGVDALDLDTIERYFRLHYWQRARDWDGGVGPDHRTVGLTDLLSPRTLAFRTAASHYRIIDDWAESIVVPYGEKGRRICDGLQNTRQPDRRLFRDAQRFTVGVSPRFLARLAASGHAVVSPAGPTVLVYSSLYDDQLGLRLEGLLDPSELIT